ncbi:MAG: hypothetical protein IJ272_03730 [Clostridia bacterium]|nr:hypothetical protein [Clostridia bacterium]
MIFAAMAVVLLGISLLFQLFFWLKRKTLSLDDKICLAYARIAMRALCAIFALVALVMGTYTGVTLFAIFMFDLVLLMLDVWSVKELIDKK